MGSKPGGDRYACERPTYTSALNVLNGAAKSPNRPTPRMCYAHAFVLPVNMKLCLPSPITFLVYTMALPHKTHSRRFCEARSIIVRQETLEGYIMR